MREDCHLPAVAKILLVFLRYVISLSAVGAGDAGITWQMFFEANLIRFGKI